jgi:GcrA cell cycle regulator
LAQSSAKRSQKARFAQVGNPAVRALYQPDAEPFVPAQEELVIPLKERKSIQTLAECHCRWPIGDPQHPDFHFCGKTKVAGLPYCEFHARRAFQAPQSRRREPAPAPAAIEAATTDNTKVDA